MHKDLSRDSKSSDLGFWGKLSLNNPVGFKTLFRKESDRFLSVAIQTLFAPLVSALLYVAVLGVPMQNMPSQIEGVSFLAFLIPGLVMMGMIHNAFQNCASSLMISKYNNTVQELLTLPLSALEKLMAYMFAGMYRGLLVGFITYLAVLPFVDIPLEHPVLIVMVSLMVTSTFAAFGIAAGVWATNFDQMAILNQFLILPLIFLGGVFYSIERLPPLFQKISLLNPVFYMIDSLRYGFLGVSDMSPWISISILAVFQVSSMGLSLWIFKTGYRLQS